MYIYLYIWLKDKLEQTSHASLEQGLWLGIKVFSAATLRRVRGWVGERLGWLGWQLMRITHSRAKSRKSRLCVIRIGCSSQDGSRTPPGPS